MSPFLNQFAIPINGTPPNLTAAEFVPRKKIVKTAEAFSTLGDAITKEAPKKKAAPVA